MPKVLASALAAVCLIAAVAAQDSLTGEWAMEFTTPRGGRSEYTLYLTQEGPRLTGHLTSEFGETPVKGSVNGDDVKLAWTIMENGKFVGLAHEAVFYDPDAFVQPLHTTMRFNRQAGLDNPTRRFTSNV